METQWSDRLDDRLLIQVRRRHIVRTNSITLPASLSQLSALIAICGFCALAMFACDRSSTQVHSSERNDDTGTVSGDDQVASSVPNTLEISNEFLEVAQRISESGNVYLGTRQLKRLREVQVSDLRPKDQVHHHLALSWHLLRLGEVHEAVRESDAAYALRKKVVFDYPLRLVRFSRALAYLRLAEVENCVKRNNRDCCIFPLQGGGVHVDREPAEECRRILLDVLHDEPNNLASIWILNVLAMALGEYPDGVPLSYRIPASAFESEYDIKRFKDIAAELGVNTFNLCGGVIVEDFDGDRRLDIVTSTFDPQGALTYYHNEGDGTFADLTTKANLHQQFGGLNCIGADYDGDGDMDILVLRGAWLDDLGKIRNSLLRNNGDGTFDDVTREAGLAEPAYPTQAAVWGDFNNDGHLDLYVGNECRLESPTKDGPFPSQLFMNQGDGTFVDEATIAGVTNDRFAKGVSVGDYDNDGDLDIYVSNIGANRLYQNRGDGTFKDVAGELNVTEPSGRSFATWFFDYNNDGWLDLFVVAYEANVNHLVLHYTGRKHGTERPRLYRNRGDGTFSEVGIEVGLDFPVLPMGANFGDLDNDGYLDIYLTTGEPDYQTLMPNVMLKNDNGKRFLDVTTSGGFGHLQKGHGVAFADIDNDGDQDIYHQLGGFFPGDKFHNVLFENPGHDNRFVIVRLIGTTSHRSGIGARIHVVVNDDQGLRSIHRAVGSVSSFGGSPMRQEIGLGKAKKIERIEITWPRTAEVQIITSVELDSLIEVVEGGDYRTFRLNP